MFRKLASLFGARAAPPVVPPTAVDRFGFPDGKLPLGHDVWPFLEDASPSYMLDLLQAIQDKELRDSNFIGSNS